MQPKAVRLARNRMRAAKNKNTGQATMRKWACHEHPLKTHNEAVTKNPISQARQSKVFQATTKPEKPVQRIAHPRASRPATVHLPAVRDVDKAFAQRVRQVVFKAAEELNEANQRTICAHLRALPWSWK